MAFRNSILAGTTLVRKAIQSENYVPGVTGWSINRDGSADLQNVATRGQWRVQNQASGDAYIEGGIVGNIPYIKWNTLLGLTSYSFLAQAISTVGVPRLRIHGEPLADNAALVFAQSLGIVLETSASARAILYDRLDGFLKLGTFAPWVEEGWQNVSGFGGGWVSAPAPNTAQYKLFPDGMVRFRGWLQSGITAALTPIFTMPVGYRPQTNCYFVVAKPNANTTHATVDVQTSGVARLIANVNNGAVGGTAASLALDQVAYSTI